MNPLLLLPDQKAEQGIRVEVNSTFFTMAALKAKLNTDGCTSKIRATLCSKSQDFRTEQVIR
jgi:hypothetical protein